MKMNGVIQIDLHHGVDKDPVLGGPYFWVVTTPTPSKGQMPVEKESVGSIAKNWSHSDCANAFGWILLWRLR